MQKAREILRTGHARFCLAGGVDSYLTADTLQWMDGLGTLKSSANRNGFPPGEAAGFCLLTTKETSRQFRLPVLGWLETFGSAHENCPIRTPTICVGRGLSDAIQQATAPLRLPDERIDETICDLNGEPYRSEEFALTVLRTQLAFVDATRFVTPADCWGDVGAASGPLFVNLAVAAGLRGYAKGPRTMVWASSEGGERAAAVVHTPASGRVGP
jgi:3-oxoacyl-[acyl-carrier-protein] synthase-1